MGNPSELFAGSSSRDALPKREDQLPEDWRLARLARLNLLLIHRTRPIDNVLGLIARDLPKPIVAWAPGERLVLPTFGHAGTMILRDVGSLTRDDQRRLMKWLERAAGQTQVVSTTQTPLLPRVQTGRFDDALYYRLNTVCVDCDAIEIDI